MLIQVLPWSVNRFVRNEPFARVDLQSITYNLNLSHWEWDDNKFLNNQFSHPYHGNLYFNTFRTNGYSFWQSVPAAFAGSFMWEVAWETHPGAPNDFINTSLGGIALGEMTYRIARNLVNEEKRGFERQTQEVLALLINPVYGFNRILDGKWGRVRYQPDCPRTPVDLDGVVDIGFRRYSQKIEDLLDKGHNQAYARIKLQYGDPYKRYKKPFDHFSLLVEAGVDDSAALNILRLSGSLHGWPLQERERSAHMADISLHYDYYNKPSFFYSAQSVDFSILSRYTLTPFARLNTQVGLGAVILAAIPDEYLYYGEGRNYDYGPGLGMQASGRLELFNKLSFSANYRGGWSKTLNGNKSSFFLNTFSSEIRYDYWRNFSTSFEWGHFSLNGYYKKMDNVSKTFPYLRLSTGIRF